MTQTEFPGRSCRAFGTTDGQKNTAPVAPGAAGPCGKERWPKWVGVNARSARDIVDLAAKGHYKMPAASCRSSAQRHRDCHECSITHLSGWAHPYPGQNELSLLHVRLIASSPTHPDVRRSTKQTSRSRGSVPLLIRVACLFYLGVREAGLCFDCSVSIIRPPRRSMGI